MKKVTLKISAMSSIVGSTKLGLSNNTKMMCIGFRTC